MWMTLYNDSKGIPVSDSVQLDVDPGQWLGEPNCRVGSIASWFVDGIVIVLSDTELTTST